MNERRAALHELGAALRDVHRELLIATQKGFEKLHGRVPGSGALLKLAVDDPLFAWLRPLSARIAALDELAKSDAASAAQLDRALADIAALLEADSEFRASYLIYLQAEPAVVVAHGIVRRMLRRLAAADEGAGR